MTPVSRAVAVRSATQPDLPAIRAIYNEGIADRVATLDEEPKSASDIAAWWSDHGGRHGVVVAERDAAVVGWCSLNRYSQRCAYDGVADLSVYVARAERGTGVGFALLGAIERLARENGFDKIVLLTFTFNANGQALYRKAGYREVGIFRNHGRLDGRFVDVTAMEKLLAG
jgi:L-amino acid N-acyltransferase YncA